MKFSNDGKYILLATNENSIFLIDSFSGIKAQTYQSFVNDNSLTLEASFSPDAQYVLSGTSFHFCHYLFNNTTICSEKVCFPILKKQLLIARNILG